MSRRNKAAPVELDEEPAEVQENRNLFQRAKRDMEDIKFDFEVTEKEEAAWQKVDVDKKKQCLANTIRMFVMRGTKRENVTKAMVGTAMESVDPTLKKHCNANLRDVQKSLRDIFGYGIISADKLATGGDNESAGKATEYLLFNKVQSPALLQIFAEESGDNAAAYQGFCFVVFQAIWASHKRLIDELSLLKKVREVDSRFPEYLQPAAQRSRKSDTFAYGDVAAAVPELGANFSTLIARMLKEKYLLSVKVDDITTEGGLSEIKKFTLGPRFYLEMGKEQLVKCYFQGQGQDVDPVALAEVREEQFLVEEVEEEEEGLAPVSQPEAPPPIASSSSSSSTVPSNKRSRRG